MARGMCQAEVTSAQRSPSAGAAAARALRAFSAVLRERFS